MYDNMRDCIHNKDYKWIIQARRFDKEGNDMTPKFGGITVFDSFEALNKHSRLLRDSLAKSKFTE